MRGGQGGTANNKGKGWLTVISGKPGPKAKRAMTVLPAAIPDCPEHLDGVATIEWLRVTEILAGSGVLTLVDRGVLAAYCMAWSRLVQLQEQFEADKDGPVVEKGRYGDKAIHPLVPAISQTTTQVLRLAESLGFTPESRGKVKPVTAEEQSKLAEFLADA